MYIGGPFDPRATSRVFGPAGTSDTARCLHLVNERTIDAAKDAALGKHKIDVIGTPSASGAATLVTFEIDVKNG